MGRFVCILSLDNSRIDYYERLVVNDSYNRQTYVNKNTPENTYIILVCCQPINKSISANKSSNNGTEKGGENLSSFNFTLYSWLGNEFNSHNIFNTKTQNKVASEVFIEFQGIGTPLRWCTRNETSMADLIIGPCDSIIFCISTY